MIINNKQQLEDLVSNLHNSNLFALDTETTSLNIQTLNLVGISITYKCGGYNNFYIPVGHLQIEDMFAQGKYQDGQLQLDYVIEKLKPVLESDIKKLYFNAKFDIKVLRKYGINCGGTYWDSQTALFLHNELRPRRKSLKDYSKYYLKRESKKFKEVLKEFKAENIAYVPLEVAGKYAEDDSLNTYQLYEYLHNSKKLEHENLVEEFDINMKVLPVLTDMEYRGVKIDTKVLPKLGEKCVDIYMKMEKEIKDVLNAPDLNINSSQQLGKLLYLHLGIPVLKRTPKSKVPSVDKDVLEQLKSKYDIADKIIAYRTYYKLNSTFIEGIKEALGEDEILHTSFNQSRARSGRLSSSNPNMQNVPKKKDILGLRKLFLPRKGFKLGKADYSQMETRLMAHYSRDKKLVRALEDGEDLHQRTADTCGVSRDGAKCINFGIPYGITKFGLSKMLKCTHWDAQKYIDKYFNYYTELGEWIERVKAEVRQYKVISTMFGWKRRFYDINFSNKFEKDGAENAGVNHRIQGTGSDIIKIAMINIHNKIKKYKYPVHLLLQVHDELVFEAEDGFEDFAVNFIKTEMENAVKLRVALPVDVDILDSWGG